MTQGSAGVDALEVRGEPCTRCERRFDDLVGQVCGKGVAKVPGHSAGSGWDWVPCPDCKGTGFVSPELDA